MFARGVASPVFAIWLLLALHSLGLPCEARAVPVKRPQISRAARSAHLAELKVLGLERFLDLRLPVARRMLLRLLLLRGRGRAGGQAVQHLPDVEFPHGLGRAPPLPERGAQRSPRAGGTSPGRGQLRRRSGGEWECEGKEAAGEKQKVIQTGNTATTRERRPPEPRAATPLPPRPPPPPRSAARRHSSGGGAQSPLCPASPGRGLTLRRAAAPARPRRRRRVHGGWPRRSSLAPTPQSLGASSRSCGSSCSPESLALRPQPPLGLPAAQRRCPLGIARKAPGVGARALRFARPPLDPPALAPSEPWLPASGAGAARDPARPLPLAGAGASALGTNARPEQQQRQPRVQRPPRWWRQLGLRRVELLSMRTPTANPLSPSSAGMELGLKLSSAKIPDHD